MEQDLYEQFEDTKGGTRSRKSKKDRQCNCKKKKGKWQTMFYKTLDGKLKTQHEPYCNVDIML